jgi:hypothetical protein
MIQRKPVTPESLRAEELRLLDQLEAAEPARPVANPCDSEDLCLHFVCGEQQAESALSKTQRKRLGQEHRRHKVWKVRKLVRISQVVRRGARAID